jgi:hypothetical protein
MLSLAGALRALADEHNVAVLVRLAPRHCSPALRSSCPCMLLQITNHTVSGRDGDTGSLKPALGETWKSQRACPTHMDARTSRTNVADAAWRRANAAHTRVQLSVAPPNSSRPDLNSAEVTLGRGRGRRAQYTLAAEGPLGAAAGAQQRAAR